MRRIQLRSTVWIMVLLPLAASPSAAQVPTVTVLHSFDGLDGSLPGPLLAVGQDLWGVTRSGGLSGFGSIFRMSRSGTLTTLYSFLGLGDGALPLGLALGSDGAVYGTTAHIVRTYFGLPDIPGTFFRIAPSGVLTTLYVFGGLGIGYQPGPLMVTHDGTMYGYTDRGGFEDQGALFQASTNGELIPVHEFTARDKDGPFNSPLVEASDGNLWGTTTSSSQGALINITRTGGLSSVPVPAGFTWLHDLVPALDGTLYGTAHWAGYPEYPDSMLNLTTSGAFRGGAAFANTALAFRTQAADSSWYATANNTILHVATSFQFTLFAAAPASPFPTLGPSDSATLVDGLDGYLYGTTAHGGMFWNGTVFRVSVAGGAKRVVGDFDGDRKADPAVYRPSTGVWYVAGSASPPSALQFGFPGDAPVLADFDGDGRMDAILFRSSENTWDFRMTGSGEATALTFGQPGDIAVPADFDGDGFTDAAVFRPSDGHWFSTNQSAGSPNIVLWGVSGDVPLPGDYDGDGTADRAVFRPGNGVWYILRSTDYQAISRVWGIPGDIPVPADYDGDGRTDIAMYRPSTGQWFILTSSSNFTASVAYQWGTTDDRPVPADYDGDGKADLAVYRTGYWFILKSSTNYTAWEAIQWGLPGDVPLIGPPTLP